MVTVRTTVHPRFARTRECDPWHMRGPFELTARHVRPGRPSATDHARRPGAHQVLRSLARPPPTSPASADPATLATIRKEGGNRRSVVPPTQPRRRPWRPTSTAALRPLCNTGYHGGTPAPRVIALKVRWSECGPSFWASRARPCQPLLPRPIWHSQPEGSWSAKRPQKVFIQPARGDVESTDQNSCRPRRCARHLHLRCCRWQAPFDVTT
jgi:hypothetical protein